MKNLKNTVLMMVVATILTFATSCKKHDEVKPQVIVTPPTDTTVTVTNKAPEFKKTIDSVLMKGGTIDLSTMITDEDISKVKITSVSGNSIHVNVNYNGLKITISQIDTLYAGFENLLVSVTDGVNVTTKTISIKLGTDNDINTYKTYTDLKPFLNRELQGNSLQGKIKFNSNGTIYLSTQQNTGGMFPNAPSPSSNPSTYTFNISGSNLNINVGLNYTYTINIVNNKLQLDGKYNLY